MAFLIVYFFGLIVTLPFAISFHYLLAEKYKFAESALFKAIVYGICCAPCVVELGDGVRNKAEKLKCFAPLNIVNFLFDNYFFNFMTVDIKG